MVNVVGRVKYEHVTRATYIYHWRPTVNEQQYDIIFSRLIAVACSSYESFYCKPYLNQVLEWADLDTEIKTAQLKDASPMLCPRICVQRTDTISVSTGSARSSGLVSIRIYPTYD